MRYLAIVLAILALLGLGCVLYQFSTKNVEAPPPPTSPMMIALRAAENAVLSAKIAVDASREASESAKIAIEAARISALLQPKAAEEKPKEVEWFTFGANSPGLPVDVIEYDPKKDLLDSYLSPVVIRSIIPVAWLDGDGRFMTTSNHPVPLDGVEFVARTDDVKQLAVRFAEVPKPKAWQRELHDFHRAQITCPSEVLPKWQAWLERVKREHAEYVAAERKKAEEAAPKPRMILPPEEKK